MLEERWVWVNGEFVPWSDATVHMMCHSFARGSAIFEVISFYALAAGGSAVFRLREHAARFFRTAELLQMELPCDAQSLCQAVAEAIRKNRLERGVVKVVGYYPQFAFDVEPPAQPLAIAVFTLDPAQDLKGFGDPFERGTSAGIARWRKLDPQTIPIEAKAAANYLNGMIAKLDVQKRGFEDAILLDTQGFIAEGATESVFLVTDGSLMTPALGTVLDSITRRSILQAAAFLGVTSHEGRLRPELLFEADEIFFCNTSIKVIPVRRIEDREMPAVPGPVERRFAEFLGRVVRGEEPAFKEWLYPV